MSTIKTLLVGFMAGAIIGVLYAPAKGSKTRRRLSRKGSDIKTSWNDFTSSISSKIEDIREEVDELAERTQEQSELLQVPPKQPWSPANF